jgi:hypothetical protein
VLAYIYVLLRTSAEGLYSTVVDACKLNIYHLCPPPPPAHSLKLRAMFLGRKKNLTYATFANMHEEAKLCAKTIIFLLSFIEIFILFAVAM